MLYKNRNCEVMLINSIVMKLTGTGFFVRYNSTEGKRGQWKRSWKYYDSARKRSKEGITDLFFGLFGIFKKCFSEGTMIIIHAAKYVSNKYINCMQHFSIMPLQFYVFVSRPSSFLCCVRDFKNLDSMKVKFEKVYWSVI